MFTKYTVIGISALVILSLGGYFIHVAFDKAAKEATAKCELRYKDQAIKADKEAAKDKEDIANEEREIDDIDSALSRLGIVRKDSDR